MCLYVVLKFIFMKTSYYFSKIFFMKVFALLVCVAFSVAVTYAFVFPDYSYVMSVISPVGLAVFLVILTSLEIRITCKSKESFWFGFIYHTLCAIAVFVLAYVKDVLGGYTIESGSVLFSSKSVETWQWLFPYLVYCVRLGVQSIPLDIIRSVMK